MVYLIDTDIVLDHLAAVSATGRTLKKLRCQPTDIVLDHLAAVSAATELLDMLADSALYISIITYMETYQACCAELRETLRAQGRRICSCALDLIIAATALENNLILVTRNTRDYADLLGLRLYQA